MQVLVWDEQTWSAPAIKLLWRKKMKKSVTKKRKCDCGNPKSHDEMSCEECSLDLNYIVGTNPSIVYMMPGGITVSEFLKSVKKHGVDPVGTCAICEVKYIRGGNNPNPVITDDDARCCRRCYNEIVIPARFIAVTQRYEDSLKISS